MDAPWYQKCQIYEARKRELPLVNFIFRRWRRPGNKSINSTKPGSASYHSQIVFSRVGGAPANEIINSTKPGSASYHSQIVISLVGGAPGNEIINSTKPGSASYHSQIVFSLVGGALDQICKHNDFCPPQAENFAIWCFRNTISIKESHVFILKMSKFSPPAVVKLFPPHFIPPPSRFLFPPHPPPF